MDQEEKIDSSKLQECPNPLKRMKKYHAGGFSKTVPSKDHPVMSIAEDDPQEKVVTEQRGTQTFLSAAICKSNETNFIPIETEIQEVILGKLNFLIYRMNSLEEKMDILMSAASIDYWRTSSDVMKRFPLKNHGQLLDLEKIISDEENRKNLVINLKGIGGTDVHHIVTNILKRVLSNEVAELYSWEGARKKKVFKILHLSKAILETTRVQFPCATEQMVGHFIANWLRQAKQRKIRAERIASVKNTNLLEQN